MKRGFKTAGIIFGIIVAILGIFYVDTYVYPFQSKSPNFSDVESAFNSIQIPSDWQEVSSRENRGIAGRDCDPFNSSGCFSKRKTYKILESVNNRQTAESFFKENGCKSLSVSEYEFNEKASFNFICSIEPSLSLSGNLNTAESILSVGVSTN